MKLRTTLFVLCGAFVPVSAPVLADEISGDVYINAAPGEAVPSVDVFYDRLSPYGAWVDDAQLGRVFVPNSNGFIPYRDGHWQYTDAGFVWVSTEPFAWATSHYGRWGYSQDIGRWVWAPDLTWGPSWVTWSQVGGDFGWSPMLPAVYVGLGVNVPMAAWQFCPADHVLDVNLTGYYEPPARITVLQRQATVINNYASVGGARVMVGPSAATLRSAHVTVQPVKLDMTVAGRMSATDAKAAVAHAQENKASFEANNRQKILANTKLRTVEAKTKPAELNRATPPPTRTETKTTKPETTRPEPTKAETTRPEPTKPETTRPVTRTETTRPEPTKPETTRTETSRSESTRTETTRPETTRTTTTTTTKTPPKQPLPSREQGSEHGAEHTNPDRGD